MAEAKRLEVGSKAPDFTLVNHDGTKVKLSSFKGQKVIVYFFPAALTPGCTKEAEDFNSDAECSELHRWRSGKSLFRGGCAGRAEPRIERARVNGASEIVSLRERFWVGITNQTHEKQKTNTQCRIQGTRGLGGDQGH